jgi:hypothetical protein
VTDIPFPATSSVGGKPQEGGGRLINAIPEKLADGARKTVVRKRAPGLNRIANSIDGRTHCRGFLAVGSTTLVAYDGHMEAIAPSGGAYVNTALGALDGTTPITTAKNNKFPTADLVAVTENGAFQVFTGSAPIPYPDADVGSPNSVCFGDGYFFFTYGDGTCYASDLNDTAIDPLNFTVAESKPDGLLRGVFFRQELLLMGSASIEVWQNTAQPTGFPFSRSTVIPRGLIGQWAVAGWEDGWANTLIWAGDDNVVYQMNGYTPTRISTHDVERSIQATANAGSPETIKACVYMSEGHAFWSLKSDDWCWVYDLTTQTWHERASYQSDTWRGECTVKNYGLWLCGDSTNGVVYSIDSLYYQEGNDPLVWTVTSGFASDFPRPVFVYRADFDFDMGWGVADGTNPIQTNPKVRVSWSDNGVTWSQPLERQIGAGGAYGQRVSVLRTGTTGPVGRKWKLEVSDPVYVGLLGGAMQATLREP